MNSDRQQAIDYLRAPANGPWRWAENGAVLVWRDGSTIAFREEIVQVIEWLAPNGLPAFGTLVFLLAACRGKVPTVADIVVESNAPLPTGMGKDAGLLLSARKQLRAQLEAALAHLETISQLPGELNIGVKARCVLAEAVFELAKAERHVEARAVLRGMREPMSDADLFDAERTDASGNFIRQIHIVAEGLKRHTAESLALRLRTGLDALPKELSVDLPTAERARQLIEELSRDKELGAVARAARELMAAVRLPRRLGERDQLALGGVADITNRGPLDRLLLSELAHDDLTLAVRVALNEALYLRREPPRREPPGRLALLLDSGVRLWGVPRVLAAAVALALVARDRQHSEVAAWRAVRKQLQPVDLLSRNGLTQHLGSLETTAHPGECLPAFAETVLSGGENQSVLITHRDALADPEFRRALAEHFTAPGFVAAVDRDGRFELHALPLAHRPPVCAADLDLSAIFDEQTGVSPIKNEIDPNLPAIFGVRPFQFLLPLAGKPSFWVKAEDGHTYAVLNDRQLVQFRTPTVGARVLSNNLPSGKTMWLDVAAGTVQVVKASASQRPARLLSLALPDGQLQVVDLVAGEDVRAVHRYGEVILLIRNSDVRAHSLNDGRLLGRILNPHRWMNGRYFIGQNNFYFAVWDGTNVAFEPVTLPNNFTPSVISHIFDRTGLSGPWLVHKSGRIIPTAGGEELKLPMPPAGTFGLDQVRISRDGHRLYVAIPSLDWGRQLDLESGWVLNILPTRSRNLCLDVPPALPTRNLFSSIESIARLRDGLAICGRKKRWRKITLNRQSKISICDADENDRSELLSEQSFSTTLKQTSHSCSLQLAEWPSGSKAFLDSRGLLHLKSHVASVPEISLVLSSDEIAGWTAEGHVCGPQFFFEGTHHSDPARIFANVLQFLNNL